MNYAKSLRSLRADHVRMSISSHYLKNKNREWLYMNKRREEFNNWQSRARRDLEKLTKKEIKSSSKSNSTSAKYQDLKIALKKRVLRVRNAMRNY
jgi:hypothetical protein